jgi:hypothetical protein
VLAFNVCLIRFPNGPINRFEAYREVAETVRYGLRHLNLDVTIGDNHIISDRVNIIFGFHVLAPHMQFPLDTIFYNMEQVPVDKKQKPIITEIKNRFMVWDYNWKNCEAFRHFGAQFVTHVPIGYVPEMTRIISAPEQDIDVLFYGKMNDERTQVMRELEATGVRVQILDSVYGAERDKYIARAKLVLNLHLYGTQIFEVARVSYLLANSKCVVSELTPNTDIEPDFLNAMPLVSRAQLVTTCVSLVNDSEQRATWEKRGHEIMAARDECAYLQEALRETWPFFSFARTQPVPEWLT